MRYSRLMAMILFAGATAMAQDWRYEARDLRHDYARQERLHDDMAADRWRLNRDLRLGRQGAAARDARDLARDQRALQRQRRDIRRDKAEMYWDRRR